MNFYKLMMQMFNLTMYADGGEGGGGDAGGASDGGDAGDNAGGGAGDDALLAGVFKDQDALVKGYAELQAAFSGKDEAHKTELAAFAAPESYAASEEWGELDPMGNRMLSVLEQVGKEHNLTQGAYEALFNGISEMQTRVANDALEEAQKSIPNFDNRANALIDTAGRFLRPDQLEALDGAMQTKESFEAMELLIGQLRGGALPNVTNPNVGESEAEIRAAIKKLNPADTRERERLMTALNAKGGGEGRLI